MRFVKDIQHMKDRAFEQGKIFQRVITEKHLHYDGWTLVSAFPTRATLSLSSIHSLELKFVYNRVVEICVCYERRKQFGVEPQ